MLAGDISHLPAQATRQHKWSYLCWRVAYVARQHRWTHHLKNSNFQMVSNEETINMKVVDPDKL
jgi:hypothetical protein